MLGELLIYEMHSTVYALSTTQVCKTGKKILFFDFSVRSPYLSKLITTRVKELTKTEMPCEVGKGANCSFF